jgi:hypothetical protein
LYFDTNLLLRLTRTKKKMFAGVEAGTNAGTGALPHSMHTHTTLNTHTHHTQYTHTPHSIHTHTKHSTHRET